MTKYGFKFINLKGKQMLLHKTSLKKCLLIFKNLTELAKCV